MPMCRLTSQMKPNSAVMIVVMNSAMGSATHGGPVELAARPLAEIVQPGDLAHAVLVADPQQREADHQPDRRHADDLVERRAAALGALRHVLH